MLRPMVLAWVGLVGLVAVPVALAQGPKEVGQARDLWKVGKYAEALETFETLAKKPDLTPSVRDAIALGRADCLDSTGEPDQAMTLLREVAEAKDNKADNPDVWARLGDIQLSRGDWEGAEASSSRALKASPNHLLGRWVAARLFEVKGEQEKAELALQWFVDYQVENRDQLARDVPGLLIVGQAAEKYVRAKFRDEDLNEQLNIIINKLYEVAIQVDPDCWQAHYLEGRLFLAGYQEGDARKDLTKALKINPSAAEVIVTLGLADLQGYKLAAGRKKAGAGARDQPQDACRPDPPGRPEHLR